MQHEPFSVAGKTYQTTGNFRGYLVTAQVECLYNAHLRGHIRAEIFLPSDYYSTVPAGPTKAMETFLRTEILLTW
ncbi:MAG: hypothetical protein PHQ04_02415 [Opitutaceae bacterium]|nr:hypothetical protein [Opitutaceae bacterium]